MQQRVDRENAAEQALALARQEYNQRMMLLEQTKEQLQLLWQDTGQMKQNFFEIFQHSFYGAALKNKISRQESDVQEAGLAVEQKREEAVQARVERQVLDTLKDKHLQDYKRMLENMEQKEVDELSRNIYMQRLRQLQG
ncbi:MAG: hypothetical protein GX949_07065 [Peptococcaceae bacterium]|nr:hypothetical protein [Peptococcaceae bacterium]